MHIIEARNVNDALASGLRYLAAEGIEETSRNGNVIVAPGPVCTVYSHPWERVLFSPLRDANPYFHLMESLWMLAGRNDVAFPAFFAANIRNYSDDGTTMHGAYGHRWLEWFGYDQLELIIQELSKNPDSRRCVLAMWDANSVREQEDRFNVLGQLSFRRISDLEVVLANGKDVPCNTHAYVDLRDNKLNITVLCRSNDIYWGAYGANAVHFSVLQEYLAAQIVCGVGEYRQFSNNYHIYTNTVKRDDFERIAEDCRQWDHYPAGVRPLPVVTMDIDDWERDLLLFFQMADAVLKHGLGPEYQVPREKLKTHFFRNTAVPMFMSYYERKNKLSSGMGWVQKMESSDWRIACEEWILRREQR